MYNSLSSWIVAALSIGMVVSAIGLRATLGHADAKFGVTLRKQTGEPAAVGNDQAHFERRWVWPLSICLLAQGVVVYLLEFL